MRLLAIHAHPDDEASKGAPTVAKYVAEGHEAVLVCATGGEEGDILNPVMDRPEIKENLPAVRAEELNKSVEAIGYHHLEWLGYRDSGMPDEDANLNPDCFAAADLDEAVDRFARLIRQYRPHVIITYSDDQQGYKHPDHLRVYDITYPAVDLAADPSALTDAGEAWQVQKVYYSSWSRARLTAHHETFLRLELESPYDEKWFERPSQDHRITTKINIQSHYGARRAALLAHATQVDPTEKFWFGLPDDEASAAYPYEDYILGRSLVDNGVPEGQFEDDLFAGITEDSDDGSEVSANG